MRRNRETWSDLDLKTKIAYISAIVAFCIGWILTIAAFIVPPVAAIEESVLWVLGQALLYSASVLGIGLYVTGSVRNMKKSIGHFMAREMKRYGQEPDEDEEDVEEEEDNQEA